MAISLQQDIKIKPFKLYLKVYNIYIIYLYNLLSTSACVLSIYFLDDGKVTSPYAYLILSSLWVKEYRGGSLNYLGLGIKCVLRLQVECSGSWKQTMVKYCETLPKIELTYD